MRSNKKVANDYAQLFWLVQQDADVKKRRTLVKRLQETDILRPSDGVGNIIVDFARTLAKPGVAVIGSTAFAAYSNNYGLTAVAPNLAATKDVDVLCTQLSVISGPVQGKANSATRVAADGQASIDFLAPRRPTGGSDSTADPGRHFTWVPRLQTYVHLLPADRALLMKELVTVAIPHDAGVLVRVPEPIHYAMHKLMMSQSRTNPEKAQKDAGQARIILEHAVIESPDKLDQVAKEFAAYGNGVLACPIMAALTESRSALPAFNAWRQHAIRKIFSAAPQVK